MTKSGSPTHAALKEKTNQNPEKIYTVVKRNGTLVPFRKERIFRALEAAFRDTKKVDKSEPLRDEVKQLVQEVSEQVVRQVTSLGSKGACLTVEGIQDVVEVTLMKAGHHDVARDYIIYRDHHKALREDSPQNLKVMRKDGSIVRFNPMKIAHAIEESFRRTQQVDGPSPEGIIDAVNLITQKVVTRAVTISKGTTSLTIVLIENEIEQQLMREGFFVAAKDYILHRASMGEQSKPQATTDLSIEEEEAETRHFSILKGDGTSVKMSEAQLFSRLKFACRALEDRVSAKDLLQQAMTNFYDGIKETEIDLTLIFSARAKIEIDPAYSQVSSRLLLDTIYRETIGIPANNPNLESMHREYFKKTLKHAISIQRIHPSLLDFDLDVLAQAMQLQRDDLFSYLGLQTLYDRYFIHEDQRRLETPQMFWMRVAMGLALSEKEQKNERAIEFYDVLSKFLFVSGTPTLFNSGTMTQQLSSCYLSTVMDDLGHIFKVVSDDAQLSKWAGGLGNDWSNVRATGSVIKGTNGKSQGVIPFLKVANDTAVAVNQCFHPDTRIFTGAGVQPIANVEVGNLVLGISGTYREVTEKMVYNQKDPMISVKVEHSIDALHVTAGHPFYAIQGMPMEQVDEITLERLTTGKVRAGWIDANQLKKGDYVALAIPKEVVAVPEFTEEDARLYGILLGIGHLSKDGCQWRVSGNLEVDNHLEFVQEYLTKRNIHFWKTQGDDIYAQIHWAAGREAVQDATTGQFISAGTATLPFEYEDIYDAEEQKWIAPRFSHLPRNQSLALLQGLLEADETLSRKEEFTFSSSSLHLAEGVRYQCLRFGIPTTGNLIEGQTPYYDIQIPAFAELAVRLDCEPLAKQNWLSTNGFVWSRVSATQDIERTAIVVDLKVEGDESYMTTSGLAHNGGKRKGAMCAYLETWHLDIEDFLELRKNTGDERRRTHDMNTANWIPDVFMKRVAENGTWTLFSPSDTPDLHDLYGQRFEKRYAEYEKMVDEGKIKLYKRVEATQLWRKMLSMLFETGHPWITFKDPSNIRSPQDHVGVVHSSNLCTEILLNTSAEETAVCNLGSLNLPFHMTEKGIDEKKLASTIRTAIRMLDNVIDINYYPVPEAKTANQRHRPIGLGVMGFQDALYIQNISYASHEAVKFADTSMELISYYAIFASSDLARERGAYPTYKGSKWDRGFLPMDTMALLEKERDGYLDMDRSAQLNWMPVRESIKKYGMRNSNTLAIAPTATIANITGVTQSIEPMYKHLYVKSNLSGEFTVPSTYLVERLKSLGLWDQEMIDDLKYFDGSIKEIDRIPQEVKDVFLTAFDIDPEWLIECASRRQKWIDMGQSLNLYLSEPSGKKLYQMYMTAWTKGLKTTYYMRSLGATQIEKSTMDVNKRGLQPRWMKNKSASSNIQIVREDTPTPVVEEKTKPLSCSLDEGCESCQ